MKKFLEEPFRYPDVADPRPKPAVPLEISGVGDEDTLRSQNVELTSELSETKDQLRNAKQRCVIFSRERNSAKRKAANYDALRKRQRADHEKIKYWQARAEENRFEISASSKVADLEKEKRQLEQHVTVLETQVALLKDELADTLAEKV